MPIFSELKTFEPGKPIEKINGFPYILCNEQKQQVTLENLTSSPETNNSLHLGFSVWFNLDIICKTKPFYAAVFDVDPNVCNYIYPLFQSLLTSCKTREEFISLFINKIAENNEIGADYLKNELQEMIKTQTNGFLATEDNFLYLVEMVKKERIFFGKANITSEEDMEKISQWIASNNLELKTIYLSNIAEWIINDNKITFENMKTTILELIKPQTQVIDAFYPTSRKEGSGPPLRITLGDLPSYEVIKETNKKRMRYFSLDNDGATPEKKSRLTRQLFFNEEAIQKNQNTDLNQFLGIG